MRRLVTMMFVAAFTATGSLYWLHDGDLEGAVEPVLSEIDASDLDRMLDEAEGLWNAPIEAVDQPNGQDGDEAGTTGANPAPSPTE